MTENQERYELRPVEPDFPQAVGIANVLFAAIQKDYKPELIEKMLELQERFEKNEARKAYHDAMSKFKANPPEIAKDKKVGYDHKEGGGSTNYSYASLASVTDKINRALSEHGLSAGWKTDQDDKGITVTCTVTHKLGHSESTSLKAGADNSGKKNSIQAIGSTVSYLERYTILALTGLATHDMDTDGIVEPEIITEAQAKEINELIKSTGADEKATLKYAGSETVETISAKSYKKVIIALNESAKRAKKPTREPGSDDK